MTDYAIAVERLLGVAEYGSAATYAELVRTWRDARPIPSEADLQAAWAAYQAAQAAAEQAKQQSQTLHQEAMARLEAFDATALATSVNNATMVDALKPALLEISDLLGDMKTVLMTTEVE